MDRESREKKERARENALKNVALSGGVDREEKPLVRAGYVFWVGLLIAGATCAVYFQVVNHEFINFDDDLYVSENPHVQNGLTLAGLVWAFTTIHGGNWNPLTWLSLMLDCQLFGLNPGLYHLSNLLFHVLNALLLFYVFLRMTGNLWASGFVAALFALHPLHVESVAWVTERKDVLSTFFWLLTMWAYIRYTEAPGVRRYLPVLGFLILGLLSKPMLVTLPFVLLLMDFWPLGRLGTNKRALGNRLEDGNKGVFSLVMEKVPLFGIVSLFSVATFHAQSTGGAVISLEVIPLGVRVANALTSYTGYIGKMIWPVDLAVFYPYKVYISMESAVTSFLCLIAITAVGVKTWRRFPFLITGWLWYLGTLIPVIGLVKFGGQSIADRFTYVPLTGLFIMIAWGVPAITARRPLLRRVLPVSAALVLICLSTATFLQLRHWRSSLDLFRHTVDVTENNYLAHNLIGSALLKKGNLDEAVTHYSIALQIKPGYPNAHNNLGVVFLNRGDLDRAAAQFSTALQIMPDYANAHNNLGVVFLNRGDLDRAAAHFSTALQIQPDLTDARKNLEIVLLNQDKYR